MHEHGSQSPVRVGETIAGKYRVDGVLGEGGMGVVVAATHEQLDQRVALKFLLAEAATKPEIVARFTREARAAVRIQSEHVARVIDVGAMPDGLPYMVMEFLEGETFGELYARRAPLPIEETVGYIMQVCEAIAEAHSLGIVHRDLKPANLFLAKRAAGKSIVKVLDFGISKVPLTDKDVAITGPEAMMGSPGYMSPEQMFAASTADVRSDVWSLGVVMYEALTKCRPFNGTTLPELIVAIANDPHAPLRSLRADAPAALEGILDRCMQKDPAARFASIADLARALAPFAPARSAHSLERIEQLLGGDASSTSLDMATRAPLPRITKPRTEPREDGTFAPATSSSYPKKRSVLLPMSLAFVATLVIFLAGGLYLSGKQGSFLSPSAYSSSTQSAPNVSASALEATSSDIAQRDAPPTTASAPLASAAPVVTDPPVVPTAKAPTMKPGNARVVASSLPIASTPPASVAPPPSAPACHVVSYFDADGEKHFRQECQ